MVIEGMDNHLQNNISNCCVLANSGFFQVTVYLLWYFLFSFQNTLMVVIKNKELSLTRTTGLLSPSRLKDMK